MKARKPTAEDWMKDDVQAAVTSGFGKPTRPRLMPADTPDYMAPAWRGCMTWAASCPDVRRAYQKDTGDTWQPSAPGSAQHRLDEKSGADLAFLDRFIRWANDAIWGSLDDHESGEERKAGQATT